MTGNDKQYQKLEKALNQKTWPQNYLFKFIVKSTETGKIESIKTLFKDHETQIKLTYSKNGAYTSLSINAKMHNAQNIINQYKKIHELKGIIML